MSEARKVTMHSLHGHIYPLKYHIYLQPSLGGDWTLEGRESIDLAIGASTLSTILVNSLETDIFNIHLKYFAKDSDVPALVLDGASVAFDPTAETAEFDFSQPLPTAGHKDSTYSRAVLSFEFSNELQSGAEAKGVYRITTAAPDGTDSPGICTQFEPCEARLSLPCFDEPAIRSTFQVRMAMAAPPTFPALTGLSQLSVALPKDSSCKVAPSIFSNTLVEKVFEVEVPVQSLEVQAEEDFSAAAAVVASDAPADILKRSQEDIPSHTQPDNHHPTRTFTVTQFEETPNMPVYLLAVVIGHFEILQKDIVLNYDVEGKKELTPLSVRVLTPLSRSSSGQFVLDCAVQSTQYFCDNLECGLPLKKMDLVGVPLSGLGMENFGLLTFRGPDYFLVDSRTHEDLKHRIRRLIYHEVSHQWFGDLVTIDWWKFLYLKEGFARFLEYCLMDHFAPYLGYWRHFDSEIYRNAIIKDENLGSTHPVEVPIGQARSVHDIFDLISYGKAACLIRMICNYVDPSKLWTALKLFVQRNKFGAVRTEDLWISMSDVMGIDIGAIMDGWVKKACHPALYVSRIGPNQLELTQSLATNRGTWTKIDEKLRQTSLAVEHFPTASATPGDGDDLLFLVPVIVKTVSPKTGETIQEQRLVMNSRSSTVLASQSSLSLVNAGHTGFYRVCYSMELLKELTREMRAFNGDLQKLISPLDAVGLLLDASYFEGIDVNMVEINVLLAHALLRYHDKYVVNQTLKRLEEFVGAGGDNWKENKVSLLQAHFGPRLHQLRSSFNGHTLLTPLMPSITQPTQPPASTLANDLSEVDLTQICWMEGLLSPSTNLVLSVPMESLLGLLEKSALSVVSGRVASLAHKLAVLRDNTLGDYTFTEAMLEQIEARIESDTVFAGQLLDAALLTASQPLKDRLATLIAKNVNVAASWNLKNLAMNPTMLDAVLAAMETANSLAGALDPGPFCRQLVQGPFGSKKLSQIHETITNSPAIAQLSTLAQTIVDRRIQAELVAAGLSAALSQL